MENTYWAWGPARGGGERKKEREAYMYLGREEFTVGEKEGGRRADATRQKHNHKHVDARLLAGPASVYSSGISATFYTGG